MSSNWVQNILLGLIAIGFFNEVIKGVFQKKKISSSSNLDDANATKIVVDSASALLKPLTNRLREAEDEATLLRRELHNARGELQLAMEEMRDLRQENVRVTSENRQLRERLAT